MAGRSPSRDGRRVSADSGSRLLRMKSLESSPADSDVSAHPGPRWCSGPPAAAQRSRSRLRCLSSPSGPFPAEDLRSPAAGIGPLRPPARCQGNGSLPLDVRRPAPSSSCPGVKDGLQRTVRLNRVPPRLLRKYPLRRSAGRDLPGVRLPHAAIRCETISQSVAIDTPGREAVMEGSTECLDALIGSGARRLTGYQRRSFMAEVATELCEGGARQAERRFGWGRETVLKGLHEAHQGMLS